MVSGNDPQWLQFLNRRVRWLAIPNLAMPFLVLQALGFLLVNSNREFYDKLPLIPSLVFEGEVWRLLSFLAIPVSLSLIGILFALLFGYFILNSLENEWGNFKTTIYVLSSILLTIVFSLLTGYPIFRVSEFYSTWFLAAATLFPDRQIHVYFVLPVKMKYFGWLAAAFLFIRFLQGDWMDRLYLLVIYANYILFFGPSLRDRYTQWQRRRRFRSQYR